MENTPTNLVYASFLRRWAASFLDGIILAIPTTIISFFFNILGMFVGGAISGDAVNNPLLPVLGALGSFLNMGLMGVYYIYFIGKSGQTLGKKALGIKVIRLNGEAQVGYTNAFLRESVGKFISALILFIGYFMVIWDKDKQALHDKIAGTVVVKV